MRDQALGFLKRGLRPELCVQYRPNRWPGILQGPTVTKAGVGNPCHVNARITMRESTEEEGKEKPCLAMISHTHPNTVCHRKG